MYLLGFNCYLHDAAAVLVKDGEVIAAAEEERFTGKKHDGSFPVNAIKFCLDQAGITIKEVEHVCYYEKPWLLLVSHLLVYLKNLPKSMHAASSGGMLLSELNIKREFRQKFGAAGYRFTRVEHHLGHAASAFYVSPFEKAAIFTIDGSGERTTALFASGEGTKIQKLQEVYYPHSIGLMYASFTQYLGFAPNSDEYKLMGLASYGKPTYHDKMDGLLHLKEAGGFELDPTYFQYQYGIKKPYYSDKLVQLLGPPRKENDPVTDRHQDIAATLQHMTEDAIMHMLNHLAKLTGERRLCLAGGVALNCVANGKIRARTPFQEIYIQAAAHDAGAGLGAPLYVYHQLLGKERNHVMRSVSLGPQYTDAEIQSSIAQHKLAYEKSDDICTKTAQLISEGNIIGWFQGRMEFGPRALGNRSILADPRRKEMKDIINLKVKFREPFRPFAPSVLEEECGNWYESGYPSPFMLMTYNVRKEKQQLIPAPTHVDGTGRVQTVNRETNPLYWRLIDEYRKITGVPLIVNTSFNVQGQPIVRTPDQAIDCFLSTDIDCLAIGNHLLQKR